MRKTNISNELNHKPQAHARVCEEDAEENKEKNNCRLKYFAVKGSTLEACRRTVKPGIHAADFHLKDCSVHKSINTT